ncbi:hypothetical protein M378DRAFT_159644 [Amanita muscaria Koide BX008]|uniref:Uncharacterized protein n=1 Tax=Amanita muscaria (strain Koide BX008) TaxID=946122 RepID=A0A0C2SUY4_AMAMK|nr:hypothetical protein M378DRAFT_159644 [Amanita muscaria Koide BX008]
METGYCSKLHKILEWTRPEVTQVVSDIQEDIITLHSNLTCQWQCTLSLRQVQAMVQISTVNVTVHARRSSGGQESITFANVPSPPRFNDILDRLAREGTWYLEVPKSNVVLTSSP